MVLAQTDLMQQLHHPLSFGFALGKLVNFQSFADDVADAHARIERSVGILENNLHFAAHVAQLAPRQRQEILAVEDHFAAGRLDQPENRSTQSRFAATRLADQA